MPFIDDLKAAQEEAMAAVAAEREEVNGKVTELQTQLTGIFEKKHAWRLGGSGEAAAKAKH